MSVVPCRRRLFSRLTKQAGHLAAAAMLLWLLDQHVILLMHPKAALLFAVPCIDAGLGVVAHGTSAQQLLAPSGRACACQVEVT